MIKPVLLKKIESEAWRKLRGMLLEEDYTVNVFFTLLVDKLIEDHSLFHYILARLDDNKDKLNDKTA
jgi:hypothetical protein